MKLIVVLILMCSSLLSFGQTKKEKADSVHKVPFVSAYEKAKVRDYNTFQKLAQRQLREVDSVYYQFILEELRINNVDGNAIDNVQVTEEGIFYQLKVVKPRADTVKLTTKKK